MEQQINVLRAKDVIKKLGISKSTFYDWQNKKSKRYNAEFPKPICLGANSVGYIENEINNFILNSARKNGNILGENNE